MWDGRRHGLPPDGEPNIHSRGLVAAIAPRDPRDMAKAGLLEAQSSGDGRTHPSETTPAADAALCLGLTPRSRHPGAWSDAQ